MMLGQGLALGGRGMMNNGRPSLKDDFSRLRQGRVGKMHSGAGLSHFLLQNSKGLNPDPGFGMHGAMSAVPELTGLQGTHQDASQTSQWKHNQPKVPGHSNALLEDDHLKMLLGDVNSELMLRVQKASAALDKVWNLLDTDGDGLISYYETRSVFAQWDVALANEVENHVRDNERSSESRINYSRFVDIFLPLAMTVPPELIFEHLTSRFAQATAHLRDKKRTTVTAHSMEDPNDAKRGSAHMRRSVHGGVTDASHGMVGWDSVKKAESFRKKGSVHRRDDDPNSGLGNAAGSDKHPPSTANRGSIPPLTKRGSAEHVNGVGRGSLEFGPSSSQSTSKEKIEAMRQGGAMRSSKRESGAVPDRQSLFNQAITKGSVVRTLLTGAKGSI